MLTGSATIGVMRSAHVKMPTLRRRHQAKALTRLSTFDPKFDFFHVVN